MAHTTTGRSARPVLTFDRCLARATASAGTASTGRSTVGRPAIFTSEQAVQAAVRAGLARFSVKSVARELGVSPAAVYQRFGTRRGLLNACITSSFEQVAPLTGAPDRRGTLVLFSDQWWRLCLRCPEIEMVIRDYQDPGLLLMASPFLTYSDRLRELGLSTGQTAFAGSMIAMNLLRLRHRLPGCAVPPESVPQAVDSQRRTNIAFILDTLTAEWPERRLLADSGEEVRMTAGDESDE